MAAIHFDFHLDAGADWQRVVRVRDSNTGNLLPITDAVMEIRNSNYILALRLDGPSSRCVVLEDGCTVQLHITSDDSLTYLSKSNYPGSIQSVGIWGIGRSFNYDLFVVYQDNGLQDRLLRGYFYVDPNITKMQPPVNSLLTIGERGSY